MKKKIIFTSQGHRADIGPYQINRILPNRYVDAVGPFVFLDHALPMQHEANETPRKANGEGAHPHRGIATLTYMFNGEAVHLDSRGHFARVQSGGVQWMKAGNGIIHDEVINADHNTNNLLTHALQFWVNLPAKNKAEAPEYVPLQTNDVPQQKLDDNCWIKVLIGKYETLESKIPTYTKQFIYHIHLEAGKAFSIPTEKSYEYAAFLPLHDAAINDHDYKHGDFVVFDHDDGIIDIHNNTAGAIDVILFGGEPYTEPIVAQGPFVMNTHAEISKAYSDYFEGKYGKVNYAVAD